MTLKRKSTLRFTSVPQIFLPPVQRKMLEVNHQDRSEVIRGTVQAAHKIGVKTGRKARTYGDGERRLCVDTDCSTRLSIYNPVETCNRHTGYGKPHILRGEKIRAGGEKNRKVTPGKKVVEIWMGK